MGPSAFGVDFGARFGCETRPSLSRGTRAAAVRWPRRVGQFAAARHGKEVATRRVPEGPRLRRLTREGVPRRCRVDDTQQQRCLQPAGMVSATRQAPGLEARRTVSVRCV